MSEDLVLFATIKDSSDYSVCTLFAPARRLELWPR
jgi:hypothetical protein